MQHSISHTSRYALQAGIAATVLLAGCAPQEPPASTSPPMNAPQAPAPGADASGANGPAEATTTVASGADLYKQHCQGCHGDRGQGVKGAGVRLESDEEAAELRDVITNGRKKMPAFKTTLTEEQMTAVIGHLRTLPSGQEEGEGKEHEGEGG